MATLYTTFGKYAFPHDLETIQIDRDPADAATALVTAMVDSTQVFSARLEWTNGSIVLHGLSGIFEGYEKAVTFTLMVDGIEVGQARVVPCRVSVGWQTEEFLSSYFLTPARWLPLTTQPLTLYYYGTLQKSGTLVCQEYTAGGTIEEKRYLLSLGSKEAGEGLIRVGVPAIDASRLRRVKTARLYVDNHTIDLYTRPCLSTFAAEAFKIEYINAFAVKETLTLYGAAERSFKPSFTTAAFGSETINLRAEGLRSWKLTATLLSRDELPRLEDLCRSRYVICSQLEGGELRPTAAEVKDEGLRTDAPSISLTLEAVSQWLAW